MVQGKRQLAQLRRERLRRDSKNFLFDKDDAVIKMSVCRRLLFAPTCYIFKSKELDMFSLDCFHILSATIHTSHTVHHIVHFCVIATLDHISHVSISIKLQVTMTKCILY